MRLHYPLLVIAFISQTALCQKTLNLNAPELSNVTEGEKINLIQDNNNTGNSYIVSTIDPAYLIKDQENVKKYTAFWLRSVDTPQSNTLVLRHQNETTPKKATDLDLFTARYEQIQNLTLDYNSISKKFSVQDRQILGETWRIASPDHIQFSKDWAHVTYKKERHYFTDFISLKAENKNNNPRTWEELDYELNRWQIGADIAYAVTALGACAVIYKKFIAK